MSLSYLHSRCLCISLMIALSYDSLLYNEERDFFCSMHAVFLTILGRLLVRAVHAAHR